MKTGKRICVILLALILVLALGTTALAADTGSISLSDAVVGKTYDVYKIFDLTYTGTAPNVKAAYTVSAEWAGFFSGTGAKYLSSTNTGNALNEVMFGGLKKYINITGDNVAEFAKDALAAAVDMTPTATKTAESTTVKFENLKLGYYLVNPRGASVISEDYASVCSLTSTLPEAEIDIKATYPSITKTVNDREADIGQTVTYTITGKVPDTTGYTAYDYTVKDTMSSGLTFNQAVANFRVTINGTPVAVTPSYESNGFSVTIDVLNQQANVGKNIVITYSAVLNSGAVNGVDGNKNSATLTYSNDPGNSESKTTTPPVFDTVVTGTLEILKVDGNNDTVKLQNAKFVLMNELEKYYKFTPAAGNTPDRVEWVDEVENATAIITDANGLAYVRGLSGDGTYKLYETEAPDGYNLLQNFETVNIAPRTQTTTEFFHITIKNFSGTVLPGTGGIGTTIFYVIGGLLVAGAVVLLITRKRTSVNDD